MWVGIRPKGEIAKHKARMVAKGFLQKLGIDFDKVYAPMERLETYKNYCVNYIIQRMEVASTKCKVSIFEWTFGRRSLC